jgi:hypothetical protein
LENARSLFNDVAGAAGGAEEPGLGQRQQVEIPEGRKLPGRIFT